jgi:hypothetical protein
MTSRQFSKSEKRIMRREKRISKKSDNEKNLTDFLNDTKKKEKITKEILTEAEQLLSQPCVDAAKFAWARDIVIDQLKLDKEVTHRLNLKYLPFLNTQCKNIWFSFDVLLTIFSAKQTICMKVEGSLYNGEFRFIHRSGKKPFNYHISLGKITEEILKGDSFYITKKIKQEIKKYLDLDVESVCFTDFIDLDKMYEEHKINEEKERREMFFEMQWGMYGDDDY